MVQSQSVRGGSERVIYRRLRQQNVVLPEMRSMAGGRVRSGLRRGQIVTRGKMGK